MLLRLDLVPLEIGGVTLTLRQQLDCPIPQRWGFDIEKYIVPLLVVTMTKRHLTFDLAIIAQSLLTGWQKENES